MTIKTLEQMTIDQLEEQIKTDETTLSKHASVLKTKRAMAKALKKQANYQPFHETKFGRGYLRTIRFMTDGLSNLNFKADQALESPNKFAARKLLNQAGKVLAKCEKLSDNSHKKAGKMSLIAAGIVVQLETMSEAEGHGDQEACTDAANYLDTQVQRLRPVLTPEQVASREVALKAANSTLEGVPAC